MALNVSPIGINFEAFSNTSSLQFNLTNKTASEFVNDLPTQANSLTGDYFGIIILSAILIYLLYAFTDISNFGAFRYSGTRAFVMASGITLTIGLIMLNLGFITNFIHVGMLLGLYLLSLVYTIISNPT